MEIKEIQNLYKEIRSLTDRISLLEENVKKIAKQTNVEIDKFLRRL